jgi:hypothetical protein
MKKLIIIGIIFVAFNCRASENLDCNHLIVDQNLRSKIFLLCLDKAAHPGTKQMKYEVDDVINACDSVAYHEAMRKPTGCDNPEKVN